jgi:hypothetical protein
MPASCLRLQLIWQIFNANLIASFVKFVSKSVLNAQKLTNQNVWATIAISTLQGVINLESLLGGILTFSKKLNKVAISSRQSPRTAFT